MKDKFYEFYKLPDEKVNEIWENGLLIVDTNVLLDLYRLGTESRKDLKKSIEFFGNRIWLPYQTGLEFHRNREKVIKDLGGSKYDEFRKTLYDKVVPELNEAFKDFRRHPCIDYKFIDQRINKFKEELDNKIETWKREYPYDIENDDVLEWVTKKYFGKVGDDNTPLQLLEIYKEGEIRYRAQVPPGYKDANNKEKKEAGDRYIFGDLIIWKSVIEKAKKDKVDIIFLTNDTKEDWYERYKGQVKGPRFELFREFHKETGQDILIMSEASFLKEMKEKKSVKVKDSSIEDAEMALKPESLVNWRETIESLPYVRTWNPSVILPNTLLDIPVAGSIGNFDPMVFHGLKGIEDYPTLLVDSNMGTIDTEYLDSLKSNPYLFMGKKKDPNDKDKK